MTEDDPLSTQQYHIPTTAEELEAAGFPNAEEVGHGGFGVVYRCPQPDLDRTVAVKVLKTVLSDENRARFFREQRALGRLTGHPNVVTILQVGDTGSGRPYIVMQYLPGDSLDISLRKHGPLTAEQALRLGIRLAGALESSHRLGVLHRDVKPANVLANEYDEPVLTDFGIARISGGFETATGTVTGSPAFTAPEVLKGDPPSPASDVYGLGATLFSALTGHAAFERHSGEQVVAQFLRITTQPPPSLREHGLSDDIAEVIGRAMSADPQQRPTTAAEFGDELRTIQLRNHTTVDDMALHSSERSRTREPNADSHSQEHAPFRKQSSPQHAMRVSKGNIPTELTSFVGRRHELSETKRLLATSRLVTLTGIGGVGKTRLALRVAETIRRAFPDGVWIVELGELQNASLLTEVVAAELNLRGDSARPLHDVLTGFVASRELLLVLDNCEHIVEAVSKFAVKLLRECPRLKILGTSREPLGIGGEAVMRVPPLTAPETDRAPSLQGLSHYDSVRLFADRATTAIPTFELNDANKDVIGHICHRLEGLPLPIELAAARLRSMSPEQVLQRLTDRYALLTRGSRTAPSRQQTLRLSVDWSFELCTELEQCVWGRASVFARSFELDAAEYVCGSGLSSEESIDLVSSLVDKSIFIREEFSGAVRFRMLETLSEYGREKLKQTGEYAVQRELHRDWYEQLVLKAESEWISAEQLRWISRLEREQPNLREALEFSESQGSIQGLRIANALFHFWHARGLYSEGRQWLNRLLATSSDAPLSDRVTALCADSLLAGDQGDRTAAAALVSEARKLTDNTHNRVARALVDLADGSLALLSGDPSQARPLLEEAADAFDDPRELSFRIRALHMLGIAYQQLGEVDRALEWQERVRATAQARGEVVYQSYALWWMAFATWRRGDGSGSIRLLEQGLQLIRQARSPSSVATSLELLAWIVSEEKSDHRRAVVLMGAAGELARSVGSAPVVFQDLRRIHHVNCERSTLRALGKHHYDAALREGQALDLDAAVAFALGKEVPNTPQTVTDSSPILTKRERQVADLVAEGLTNRAIAARLVISPRTAQGHVEHVLTKLGFTSRTQIAAWVIEQTHQ
ncbi:protein kinase domain-containing protein [Rhodococcus wratislaviensis]|uniref:Putative serine/threonine protein kinase n=1 Tax=Rhodococcus wratislaviensis NBRC 100605 TaxID=1219028 RepID=X0PUL2_RHOWR|nr:protein kinase [Rhodococcus wratislaviensis]GAF46838.1 putative serine/threonine protein kinase [Rhodococcus wratislaviensis NBRC 100605]